jgi:sugar lactone lactonase YvrE
MQIAVLFLAAAVHLAAARVDHMAGGNVESSPAPARDIRLIEPFAVDFGPDGEWYICEFKGERILRVDRSGSASVFAGTGQPGNIGDGGDAAKAMLRDPHGIVIAKNGTMYVADTLNHTIRRIDLKSRIITTIAGTGEKGAGGDGGPALKASFNGTFGIALHPGGDRLYIADLANRRVRALDLRKGTVQTLAGNGESRAPADGNAAQSSPLVDPRAVAVDSKATVYILERNGNALRRVDAAGRIYTVISPGAVQPDLNGPKHLCIDRQDRVIIADAENHLIRRYDPKTGQTTTIAGTGRKGDRIDPSDPLKTELNRPHGVTVDRSGALWVSDSYNHRILRISDI